MMSVLQPLMAVLERKKCYEGQTQHDCHRRLIMLNTDGW